MDSNWWHCCICNKPCCRYLHSECDGCTWLPEKSDHQNHSTRYVCESSRGGRGGLEERAEGAGEKERKKDEEGAMERMCGARDCVHVLYSHFLINNAGDLTSSITQTNVMCSGGSDGTATVSASGGTGPYSYLWLPRGGATASASGLYAGSYTIAITDALLNVASYNIEILQPSM